MYDPLPPDLARLQAIRTYLRLQLAAVDDKIKQIQPENRARTEHQPPKEPARPGWHLEHIPGKGGRGRGVLHRNGCWASDSKTMPVEDPALALKLPRDEITPCDVCHPERGLET